MGRDQMRVLVCAAASLVLIVAGTLVMDWYRGAAFDPGIDGAGMSTITIDLDRLRSCNALRLCTVTPLSPLPGMFPTLAAVTLWSSLAFAALVMFQAGVRLLTGNANDSIAKFGYMFALTTISIAVATAYMFGPESEGPGLELATHMGVALHRTWAPLTLIIGLTAGFATLYMAVAPDSSDLGDTYKPVTLVSLQAAPGDRAGPRPATAPAPSRAPTRPLRPRSRAGTLPGTVDPSLLRSNEQTFPGSTEPSPRNNESTYPGFTDPGLTEPIPPPGAELRFTTAQGAAGWKHSSERITVDNLSARTATLAGAGRTRLATGGGPGAQRPATVPPSNAQRPSTVPPSNAQRPVSGPLLAGQPAAALTGQRPSTVPPSGTQRPVTGPAASVTRPASGPAPTVARSVTDAYPIVRPPAGSAADAQRPVTGQNSAVRRQVTGKIAGAPRPASGQAALVGPTTTGRVPVIGPATITSQVPLIEPTPTGSQLAAGRTKSGPITPIPDHLRNRLSYVAITAELTGGGIDARREDGTSRLVLWRDVVGVVVRRMPPVYDDATFVDIVSTARSTLRIVPWTRLTGDPIEGEGDARARAVVERVVARCPIAKLDPATRHFLDTGEAAQLRDVETLHAHDARLA